MALSSSPVKPPAYSHELAELILCTRERPESGAGGRLPTERQLASDLGVTRTMIRHALAILEAEGRISREVGRGTFLRAASSLHTTSHADRAGARADEVGPADVMAGRRGGTEMRAGVAWGAEEGLSPPRSWGSGPSPSPPRWGPGAATSFCSAF